MPVRARCGGKRYVAWGRDGTGHWSVLGIVRGAGKGRQVRRLARMEGPKVRVEVTDLGYSMLDRAGWCRSMTVRLDAA